MVNDDDWTHYLLSSVAAGFGGISSSEWEAKAYFVNRYPFARCSVTF